MLADFSFTPAEQIFENLKKSGSMAGMAKPPAGAMASDVEHEDGRADVEPRRHAAPDLNDVKYDAFLANDRTLADPEIVKVEPGGLVLLRIINSSAMSAYRGRAWCARGRTDRRRRLHDRAHPRAKLSRRGRAAARYSP